MVWWSALAGGAATAEAAAAAGAGAGAAGAGAGLGSQLGASFGSAMAPYGKFAKTLGKTAGEALGNTKLAGAYNLYNAGSAVYDGAMSGNLGGAVGDVLGGTNAGKVYGMGESLYQDAFGGDTGNVAQVQGGQNGDSGQGGGAGGALSSNGGSGILTSGLFDGLLSGGDNLNSTDMSQNSAMTGINQPLSVNPAAQNPSFSDKLGSYQQSTQPVSRFSLGQDENRMGSRFLGGR